MQVRRVAQCGQPRPQLGERQRQYTLDLGGIDGDGGGAVPLTEQLLREQPAEGVADDDRRALEPANDLVVVIDDCGDVDTAERRRIAAKLLGFVNRDGVGQYGVEQSYQSTLAGQPRVVVAERDASNNLVPDTSQILLPFSDSSRRRKTLTYTTISLEF